MVTLWSSYNQDLPPLTGQTRRSRCCCRSSTRRRRPPGQHLVGDAWRSGASASITRATSSARGRSTSTPTSATTPTSPTRTTSGWAKNTAQVFHQRVVLGNAWQPLQPTSVERSGRRDHGAASTCPCRRWRWDTTLPTPHQAAYTAWAQGRGFEVPSGTHARHHQQRRDRRRQRADHRAPADLPASGVVVGYAFTADGTPRANGTVRWGQLRDSDPFVGSLTGSRRPNYCVAFQMNVP